MNIDLIEKNINYNFKDKQLITTALVHKSYMNDPNKLERITSHNERLEFLGDAVLELVTTDYLYKNLSKAEGMMTSLRSSLVNTTALAKIGRKLSFDLEIFLSPGEKAELGKARKSIVADSVEAVIGAIYLDGGIKSADRFIQENVLIYLEDIIKNKTWKDKKTILQEKIQEKLKLTPKYKIISSQGKDHEKTFVTGVFVGAEKLAEGEGKSKQKAETDAAQKALETLE